MSRSYKKNPVCADRNPELKRIYARKVRRKDLEKVPNGMAYKKLYESYNICDYKFRSTWLDHLHWFRRRMIYLYEREPTEEEIIKEKDDWERHFKRK